ncbi:hypothetical protein H9P43_001849 [Blastocladiella emersonii ATCC 22665]|nr:hypothetical protein H9P43_001849 [Blastocladiella emersonii ATCC 22665]
MPSCAGRSVVAMLRDLAEAPLDSLHSSIGLRAVPEGLLLPYFFLHANDVDNMVGCLNRLFALFPSLTVERAPLALWARVWLTEDRNTRECLNVAAETFVDSTCTFTGALALGALACWNLPAVQRLVDGSFGLTRAELVQSVSLGEVADVFLTNMCYQENAAQVVPELLEWLHDRGFRVQLENTTCYTTAYMWEPGHAALFQALFDKFDSKLLDQLDEHQRFRLGSRMAESVVHDLDHIDLVPRFAELNLIDEDAWAKLVVHLHGGEHEPMLFDLLRQLPLEKIESVLTAAVWERWRRLDNPSWTAFCRAASTLGCEPFTILKPALKNLAREDLVFLMGPESPVDSSLVFAHLIEHLLTNRDNRHVCARAIVEHLFAALGQKPQGGAMDWIFQPLDGDTPERHERQRAIIIGVLHQCIVRQTGVLQGNSGDDGEDSQAIAVLSALFARYPERGLTTSMPAAHQLVSVLRPWSRLGFDTPADTDMEKYSAFRELFTKVVAYDPEMTSQIITWRALVPVWVWQVVGATEAGRASLAKVVKVPAAQSTIRKALLNGDNNGAALVMRLVPSALKAPNFRRELVGMVAARGLPGAVEVLAEFDLVQ